jgi:hypothetical protein
MSQTFLGNLSGQLQKKFYVYFIKKVLGSWIKNPPSIDDVNVLEQELNLSYLEFENNLIDQHLQNYPFKVLSAHLENLKIPSVTWSNITNLRTYFSVDKLVLVLLIEEPIIQPPNTFLNLQKSIYQMEQDFTKSIHPDAYSHKGIKSIETIIRDTLYNMKFQINLIEIQLKSDVNQEIPLIIQLKDININQQSILNLEADEAWKYLKFNINILIDSEVVFQNFESPITFNYEINKGKISVDIPKIKSVINSLHLEKVLDLASLYQEFSTFLNQSQMSFGMYFGSENDLRSFIDLEPGDTEVSLYDILQEKIDIIEIGLFELKMIGNNPSNYLLVKLDNIKIKDLLLDNTFGINIVEIVSLKEQIVLSNSDLFDFSLKPSKQKKNHYKLEIENKNTIINFDFEIINRYTSYLSLHWPFGAYNVDPDPPKCILNFKLSNPKINIFVPDGGIPTIKYNNYLQIQTNNLVIRSEPSEIKFDNFELYLVVDENDPKIIYKSDFLRLAIQKRLFDSSNQVRTHPTLFADDPILIDQYGLYYEPIDQAGFQNFNSLIYPKVTLRILVLFGKTHLLIKEKIILSHLCQLISGILSWKPDLPPPIRSEYMVIDLKWKEFFVILENVFIVKLLCFSVQSTINFYTNQKFHYLRLEDGCIYNPRTEEVVLEKVDHRNPYLFVVAIQIDFFPKNDIQKSKIGLHFESVRVHHFLNNKFWILEFVDYFNNLSQFVPSTSTQTFKTIYISAKSLDINLIVNTNYNLTLNSQCVKISFRPNLELVVFDQLLIGIFNQILTIPILKVSRFNYHSNSDQEYPSILIENIDLTFCSDSLGTSHQIIKIISDNQDDYDKYPVQTVIDVNQDERAEIERLMIDALSSDNLMEPIILDGLPDKSGEFIDINPNFNNNYTELLDFIPVVNSIKKNTCNAIVNLEPSTIQLKLEINRTRLLMYAGQDWTHQRNANINLELLLDGIKIIKMKRHGQDNFIEMELELEDVTLSGVLDEATNRIFFQKMPHISRRLSPYNSTRSHFNASKSQSFHIHFRKDLQDCNLEFSFFPARLDINQNLINFIAEYAQNYSTAFESTTGSEDKIYFKSIKINQMYFRVNYVSNLFDCKFKNHHWILNFLSLRKLDLMFNEYYISNICGTQQVIGHLFDHYMEVLSQQKQIKIIKSITPLRSIIRLANGIVNLIIIPSKECYQSGKIIKGLKNGITNFKETTMDELRAIGYKTCDMISNTIEIFDTARSSNSEDAVIEIPYRDYNQKGILKAIQSYLKPS